MLLAKLINFLLVAVIIVLLFGFYRQWDISTAEPADLSGQDLNNNSVRDDVDQVIEDLYPSESIKKQGAYKYAQILQIMITDPEGANSRLGGNGNAKLFAAIECLPDSHYDKIEDTTLNTRARAYAYGQADRTFFGGVYTHHDKPVEACEDLIGE